MLTATPGSENVPVEGTCFQSVELSSKALESGDVEVTLHLGLPTSLLCHASFILATDKHIELEEVALNNVHSLINLLQLCYWIRYPIHPNSITALAAWWPHNYISCHRQLNPCWGLGPLHKVLLVLSCTSGSFIFHTGDPESSFIPYLQKRCSAAFLSSY